MTPGGSGALRRRFFLQATVASGLIGLGPAAAQTSDWPRQSLRFVVPFPPGGSTDPVARIIAAKLTETLGWNIIVDNKSGGAGVVGAAFAAKQPADGYTWLIVFDNHILNPLFTPDVPYKDSELANVMQIGQTPQAIGCHPARSYKTFADVIADAGQRPGKVTVSVLAASQAFVLLTQMQKDNGYEMNVIPYKAGGPLLADALAGHTDMAMASLTATIPHFSAGKLRPIAVTGAKRSPVLPDVSTLAEQGVKVPASYAWWGVYTPAGTPRPIIDRMHAELTKALRSPDVTKKFVDTYNMDVIASTPEAFAEFQKKEQETWGKAIRENNLKPE